jgi:hypothetical protein
MRREMLSSVVLRANVFQKPTLRETRHPSNMSKINVPLTSGFSAVTRTASRFHTVSIAPLAMSRNTCTIDYAMNVPLFKPAVNCGLRASKQSSEMLKF